MRKIPLKKLVGKTPKDVFDYAKTLSSILRNAPAGTGFTIEDIRIAIAILEKLEKSADALDLEDAEYEFIKKNLKQSRFKVATPELAEFLTDLGVFNG